MPQVKQLDWSRHQPKQTIKKPEYKIKVVKYNHYENKSKPTAQNQLRNRTGKKDYYATQ